MVKEIQAYQADDGSIHPTALAAAKQDARVKLKALNLFNEGSIAAVIGAAKTLTEILQPIIEADEVPAEPNPPEQN